MKNTKERSKGITLISLVITIILLLLLVGTTILQLTQSGLLEKAKQAKEQYNKSEVKEELQLSIYSIQVSNIDNFNIKTIIENLNKQNNLDLTKLEWDSTQNNEIPEGIYKKYNFYINPETYEVIIADKVPSELDKKGLIEYVTFDSNTQISEKYNIDNLNDAIRFENKEGQIGNKCVYFTANQANSRLMITNENLNFGTKDFTIECWLNYDNQVTPYTAIFSDNDNSNFQFFIQDHDVSNNISIAVSGYRRILNTGKSYTETKNQWVHYAVVRKDGVFTIYQNGKNIGQASGYETYTIDLSNLSIGGNVSSNTAYKGYMDSLSVYNYAKYEEEFTPNKNTENTNPLVFLDFEKEPEKIYSEIKGNSYDIIGNIYTTNKNKLFGKRSIYFSSDRGDSRIYTTNENLNFGTDDFTLECWANYDNQIQQYSALFSDDNNSSLQLFLHDTLASNNITLTVNGSRIINTGRSYTETKNEWVHYAVVRKGGVFTIYQNGNNIGQASGYETEEIDLTKLSLGGSASPLVAYKGYMDNFAIYNFAKYTEDFIPSKY